MVVQLAGQDPQARQSQFKSPQQNSKKLRRIGSRRCVISAAVRSVCDSRFSCVGDDKSDAFLTGSIKYASPLALRVKAAADTGNHSLTIDLITILLSSKNKSIQSILSIKAFRYLRMTAAGLYKDYLAR